MFVDTTGLSWWLVDDEFFMDYIELIMDISHYLYIYIGLYQYNIHGQVSLESRGILESSNVTTNRSNTVTMSSNHHFSKGKCTINRPSIPYVQVINRCPKSTGELRIRWSRKERSVWFWGNSPWLCKWLKFFMGIHDVKNFIDKAWQSHNSVRALKSGNIQQSVDWSNISWWFDGEVPLSWLVNYLGWWNIRINPPYKYPFYPSFLVIYMYIYISPWISCHPCH